MSLNSTMWHATWNCQKDVTYHRYTQFSFFYCTDCKCEVDIAFVSFSDEGMGSIGWTKRPHPQGGSYWVHESYNEKDPYPVWIKKEDATAITGIMVKQKKRFLEAARFHFFGKDS